jgi:hypothetical protein
LHLYYYVFGGQSVEEKSFGQQAQRESANGKLTKMRKMTGLNSILIAPVKMPK